MKNVRFVLIFAFACGGQFVSTTAVAAPAFSDPNLLNDGSTVITTTASSEFGGYEKSNANDGEGANGGAGKDFVFVQGDTVQNITFSGFDSQVGLIRLFFGDLQPTEMAIYSSLSNSTSLVAGDFETTLVTTQAIPDFASSPDKFYDFPVSAPAGTSSLLFDFGPNNYTQGGAGFSRIQEFQAFVPEPGSAFALGIASIGAMARRRRRRV